MAGGMCGRWGHVWQRGHAWQGACVAGEGMAGEVCVVGEMATAASCLNAFLWQLLLLSGMQFHNLTW